MQRLFLSSVVVILSTAAAFAGPKPPEPPPLVLPKPPPPYPAVAQKRQEKKNPPNPPTLLTKIKSNDPEDWTRTPNDLKGLLEWLSAEMSVHFSANVKSFDEISPDPTKNPMLYRSGY